MKKRFLALLSVILILSACTKANTKNLPASAESDETVSKYGRISNKQWDSIDKTYCGFDSAEDFLSDVDYYVEETCKLLGKPNLSDYYKEKYGKDVVISFTMTQGVSNASLEYIRGEKVYFNVRYKQNFFEFGLAPIAHEIAHVIAHTGTSLSLLEGIACYVQEEIGKNPSAINWGMDVTALSKFFLISEFDEVYQVIESVGRPDKRITTGTNRVVFYMLSNSFVRYLIETYGMENFMKLCESDDLEEQYKIICKKDFEQVKEDWRNYVNKYPVTIDNQKVKAEVQKILNEHNDSQK